ncbi:MAG: hypothetical protein AAF993_21640, partial [Pseudomonadota bacterium]
MPRHRLRFALWCTSLCAALLHSFAPSAWAAEDAQSTAQQLQQILQQLNALDKWFSEAEQRRTGLLVEIQQQDQDIAQLNQAVDSVQAQVLSTDAELRELRTQKANLQTQRAVQAKLIGEHVASAYRLSGQDFLKQLLNQESPDKFERMIRYHQYFSESRLEMLEEYQLTLRELADTNAQLEVQQARQTEEQRQLLTEQKALTSQRQSRATRITMMMMMTLMIRGIMRMKVKWEPVRVMIFLN